MRQGAEKINNKSRTVLEFRDNSFALPAKPRLYFAIPVHFVDVRGPNVAIWREHDATLRVAYRQVSHLQRPNNYFMSDFFGGACSCDNASVRAPFLSPARWLSLALS